MISAAIAGKLGGYLGISPAVFVVTDDCTDESVADPRPRGPCSDVLIEPERVEDPVEGIGQPVSGGQGRKEGEVGHLSGE